MPTLNGPLPPAPYTQPAPNTLPQQPLQAPPAGQPAPDPLANLRDIHLPSDVSAVPAFGWWLLAALILTAMIVGGILWWRHHQRNRYRRQAVVEWQNIGRSQKPAIEKLHLYNALLKRVARAAYPSVNTAALHGHSWQKFLSNCAPGLAMSQRVKVLMEDGLYRAEQPESNDLRELSRYSKQWIEKHRQTAPEQPPEQLEAGLQSTGEHHAHV